MVRISKLTDYGVLIMAYMTNMAMTEQSRLFQAREISQQTSIGLATVSKLLKTLAKHKLLNSHRGVNGGYSLSYSSDLITVLDLIHALEGPLAITECNLGHDYCPTQSQCAVRAPWQHINQVIKEALASVKLKDLISEKKNGVKDSHVLDIRNRKSDHFSVKIGALS